MIVTQRGAAWRGVARRGAAWRGVAQPSGGLSMFSHSGVPTASAHHPQTRHPVAAF